MCGLLAAFFRVVDRHFCRLIRTSPDVSTGVARCVVQQVKGSLRAVGRGDGNGLGAAIELLEGTFCYLQAVFANVVDLFGGVLSALAGVMHRNLSTHLEPMQSFPGSFPRGLDSVDGGASSEVESAFGPILAVEQVVSVAEGTVRKIDSSAKTILVATKDGTERTFHFAGRTTVHGVEAAGKGSREALHGLKVGTEVAVHYTSKGAEDTAEEIDHIGKDGLQVTEGTLKKFDRGAKTITIATADGAERSFHLLDHAARDAGRDIGTGADKSAKVTVYYTEEGGQKTAHFFKKAF